MRKNLLFIIFFFLFVFAFRSSVYASITCGPLVGQKTYGKSGTVTSCSLAPTTCPGSDICVSTGCTDLLGSSAVSCTGSLGNFNWSCTHTCNGCPVTSTWTCPDTVCQSTTLLSGVSCPSTYPNCHYSTSTPNSPSCGVTPTPTPQVCTAGTGTTLASCGNTPTTGCICNGASICATQGYYCNNPTTCGPGWAGGTSCPISSCPVGSICNPAVTHICDTGSCGSCNLASGVCGTGTQSCTYTSYSGGGACTVTTVSNSCQVTCPGGGTCSGGVCPCTPTDSCQNHGFNCNNFTNNCGTQSCGICPAGQSCSGNNCITTPPTSKTVSGIVYQDSNGNGSYTTSTDQPLSGPGEQVCANASCVSIAADGSYSLSLTPQASQYTITLTPPSGFSRLDPPTGYSVTVNGNCNAITPSTSFTSPGCTSGNYSNVNFLTTNSSPWIQSTGSDIRIDSGISYQIPSGSFMSITGAVSQTPGLIFTGGSGSITANKASNPIPPYGWLVGGPSYPETYSPANNGAIKTSYSFISNKYKSPKALGTTECGGTLTGGVLNCNLQSSLSNGIYIVNGNLNLNGTTPCSGSGTVPCVTFTGNKHYMFLVNGDLNINEEIHVANDGSTAFFTASGNINVANTIGESTLTSTRTNIEGYYSADQNFTVLGVSPACSGTEKRLNIGGSIVANASKGGFSFSNQRNLCAGNANPSFAVFERPDFVLNSPTLLLNSNRIYQEVAP